MKYLLAAEADRIQDLIFRSSRLREVVGGSQLLTRFCDDVPELLASRMNIEANVITRGGGSFRVEFENEDGDKAKGDALRFGAALAEAYNRATGGTLSVAKPVKIADDSEPAWKKASEDVGENLRQAKRQGPPVATPHIPYIAFCESCGVGLAEAHEGRVEGEEEGKHYICPSCRAKSAEQVTKSMGKFLKPFYRKIVSGEALSSMEWPHDADAVGKYDARGYVAYIVADGDGMGKIFHDCNRDQAQKLSKEMSEVLRQALAESLKRFMPAPAATLNPWFMPVLPLILGGDDLFALVPACWALDMAQHLCKTFQREMTEFAHRQGIQHEITMTAAVVFCKANYPYYLAHQIGERRLSEAKRVVKALAADDGPHLSAVDFEIVLGSQVEPKELTGKRRSTLRPYWVTGKKEDSEEPEEDKKEREKIEKVLRQEGWGLPIRVLLEQRLALVDTPSRRLSQLRDLFNRVSVSTPGDADARQRWNDDWDDEMKRLLKRIERDWTQKRKHPVRAALDTLGGVEIKKWYKVERKSDDERWQGHGLPDLLRVWEWTLDLDHDPVEYEGGGR